jgi:ApaG protein
MNVSAHLERGVNFTEFVTYEWGPPDNLPVGDPRLDNNPFFNDYLQGAVEKQMTAKGFTRAAEGRPADLLVHYHASVNQRLDVYRADNAAGYCYGDCEPQVVDFDQGTLVIVTQAAMASGSCRTDAATKRSRGRNVAMHPLMMHPLTLASTVELECNSSMSEQTKYDIRVSTRTRYLADQSDEASGRFVFAYTITITNVGTVSAQLISRHWIIADASEKTQEVRGLGVVGEQPLIKPQESFEYTSGTALTTGVGTMRGSYRMLAADGHEFDAPIPEFALSVPRVLH